MTLDEIINKYGTHELDIDLVKQLDDKTFIYAYCHQHEIGEQFMINHYLEIVGSFSILNKDFNDDITFHIAVITKLNDSSYTLTSAVSGDTISFLVKSDLQVNELTEKLYYKSIKLQQEHK